MDVTAHFASSYSKTNSMSNGTFSPAKSALLAHKNVNFVGYNCLPRKLKCFGGQLRNFGAAIDIVSDYESSSADDGSIRWLLQPIGDGDSRHIGYKVEMPGPIEILSNVVIVGRDREKADIVIPVPTVSALHARIERTDENLLITDFNSTNGTFINERRLQQGLVVSALPGSLVTFGDANLAIFKVYKVEQDNQCATEPETFET
ncbi:SMAD/FHA domain-containing protein [Striga hermonthica]|uniref:SMAD/FHA domain-containing protein n=1 Tax=Striga hermonthica TaxID=68872 RepID=A0A9N7R103_STRHE|nr:SMAD/FHA domain-containing protein [Striga hermonthica]